LGLAQQNTRDGKLWAMKHDENNMQDYLVTSMELFRAGRFLEARRIILANLQPEEYDDFYRVLYQNLPLFSSTQDQQDEALQIIRRACIHHATVCCIEINLAGCLIELAQLSKT
jgi:hypothetical protein